MTILGIDTSCDDTSAAVVLEGRQVAANVVSSQVDLHAVFGGVVPEIASRRHVEMMVPVVIEALGSAGCVLGDMDAVAVTMGPGLLGSLLVGLGYGKALAFGLGVPVIGVNHLEGHIYANFLREDPPPFPLLNLVASGGHSDIILMQEHGVYQVLAETRDDAAGEVFDKVARELGLPFPGGPYLDRAAEDGDPLVVHFPHPKIKDHPRDFSFSGMKTRAVQHFASSGRLPDLVPDISAGLRMGIVRDLLYSVPDFMKETGSRAFAISGGVAANSLLRKESAKLCHDLGVPLYVPPPSLCTDNGAMVAAAGSAKLERGLTSSLDLGAEPGLRISSWQEDR